MPCRRRAVRHSGMRRRPSTFSLCKDKATTYNACLSIHSGEGADMKRACLCGCAAALLALPLLAAAQTPPRAVAKVLMTRDLPDLAGKEATVTALEYPPGSS